jgi:hypothetical protein
MVTVVSTRILPPSTNLYYVTVGVVGLSVSLLIGDFDLLYKVWLPSLVTSFVLAWFRMKYAWSSNFIIIILYISFILISFYNLARWVYLGHWAAKTLMFIGRYTLFSYLFHVILIVTAAKSLFIKFGFIGNLINPAIKYNVYAA